MCRPWWTPARLHQIACNQKYSHPLSARSAKILTASTQLKLNTVQRKVESVDNFDLDLNSITIGLPGQAHTLEKETKKSKGQCFGCQSEYCNKYRVILVETPLKWKYGKPRLGVSRM